MARCSQNNLAKKTSFSESLLRERTVPDKNDHKKIKTDQRALDHPDVASDSTFDWFPFA